MYVHVQCAYTCEWPGLRKELLPSLPKAQLTHSSSRTGLTISSMLPSTTSSYQLPAGRPSSTFTVFDGVSGGQTIPGQLPWQTAACALIPAHSSIISSSQLVPLSVYSCCPGTSQDTQYCAAATGLLKPEVGSRMLSFDCVPKLIQKSFQTREQQFVQRCETKVGADACKGSY